MTKINNQDKRMMINDERKVLTQFRKAIFFLYRKIVEKSKQDHKEKGKKKTKQ